ncbi:hypothetical protein KS18_13965 [Photorhabdus luminescens]|nr:hypothetical protein KS18_13965 [Photorhabdus luminescens]
MKIFITSEQKIKLERLHDTTRDGQVRDRIKAILLDIKRYFVTPQESGELCLMSCIFGQNRDIFFPKLSEALHLITFADIAVKYLEQHGYQPYIWHE